MFKLQLECPEILSEAWCLDNLTYYIAHDIKNVTWETPAL